MGAAGAYFFESTSEHRAVTVASAHDKEKQLTREITQTVERGLPGVEVLAVELSGPERFTVFVDHPQGVDHALCERVTGLLRSYLDRYTVDVSSPGLDRPLRRPAHFRNVVGRKVSLRTAEQIGGRTRFRGEVLAADERTLRLSANGDSVEIPYESIVRGNLIYEG